MVRRVIGNVYSDKIEKLTSDSLNPDRVHTKTCQDPSVVSGLFMVN